MWYHFQFESGANPYIAKTENEARKVIRRWQRKGWKVHQIVGRYYVVDDGQPNYAPMF